MLLRGGEHMRIQWMTLAAFVTLGCTSAATTATTTNADSGELQPINLAFTFHLEGPSLVASQDAFDRYVANIRSTAELFHRNGAIATWEAAEIAEKSTTYGTNILLELETGGDAIALHANGAGYVPNDPNYTLEKMSAEIQRQRAIIDALGVHVRDVSNICSTVDWVKAVTDNNFEAVTGVVDYCLKSLSNPPSEVAACPSPDKCHGAYPHTIEESITAWYAEAGANWTTPASSGLLILPTAGAVPCAAEEAAGAISPTQCSYGDDDITAVMNELAAAIAARKPGKVHSYVMVASFGQTPNAQIIEGLFQQIKTTYIDTGSAKWRKASEIIDLFKAAN
jgi:hypothetical protein